MVFCMQLQILLNQTCPAILQADAQKKSQESVRDLSKLNEGRCWCTSEVNGISAVRERVVCRVCIPMCPSSWQEGLAQEMILIMARPARFLLLAEAHQWGIAHGRHEVRATKQSASGCDACGWQTGVWERGPRGCLSWKQLVLTPCAFCVSLWLLIPSPSLVAYDHVELGTWWDTPGTGTVLYRIPDTLHMKFLSPCFHYTLQRDALEFHSCILRPT